MNPNKNCNIYDVPSLIVPFWDHHDVGWVFRGRTAQIPLEISQNAEKVRPRPQEGPTYGRKFSLAMASREASKVPPWYCWRTRESQNLGGKQWIASKQLAQGEHQAGGGSRPVPGWWWPMMMEMNWWCWLLSIFGPKPLPPRELLQLFQSLPPHPRHRLGPSPSWRTPPTPSRGWTAEKRSRKRTNKAQRCVVIVKGRNGGK